MTFLLSENQRYIYIDSWTLIYCSIASKFCSFGFSSLYFLMFYLLMILQLCIWVFILVLQINKVLVHSFLLLSVPYSVYSPIWKTSLQMCCNSLCVFLLPIFCIFIFYALLMHISLCLTILYFSSVVFNLLLIFI